MIKKSVIIQFELAFGPAMPSFPIGPAGPGGPTVIERVENYGKLAFD